MHHSEISNIQPPEECLFPSQIGSLLLSYERTRKRLLTFTSKPLFFHLFIMSETYFFPSDGLPSSFQQPVRNILSQFSFKNASLGSGSKSSPSFSASGYQSVSDKRLEQLLRQVREKFYLRMLFLNMFSMIICWV